MIRPPHDALLPLAIGGAFGLVLVAWGVVDYLMRREQFLFPNLGRLSD